MLSHSLRCGLLSSILLVSASTASAQATNNSNVQLPRDPTTFGPPLEIAHLYYDYWPTGIAVSKSGRMFSNYPSGLDANNTVYSVAELFSNNTEVPYPSAEINSPPGGQLNYTATPITGANYQNYFIGVQSVVVDPADRLWVLDTGRPAIRGTNQLAPAAYGGPKLVGVNLQNNSIFTTIVFDPAVATALSYLNDVRFDLNSSLTPSGQGVAYISDSSGEGANGIIVVDIGAKTAFRQLNNIAQVSATQGFVPFIWGQAVYRNISATAPIENINFGVDGIALSADAQTLYFSTTAGRELYSVPTARLRDSSKTGALRANAAVQYLGQAGYCDGMETDSNNLIYRADIEGNAIVTYRPETGLVETFVRDPRISWTDTFSVGNDGYLYFTENLMQYSPMYLGGVDRRVKPYVLFRVKLPGNGTKVVQEAPM